MRIRTKRDDHGRIVVSVRGTQDPSQAEIIAAPEIRGSFPDGNYVVRVETVHTVVFTEVWD